MSDMEQSGVQDEVLKKALPDLAVKTLTPAAEELGKGLVTVAKVVNMALSPIEGFVWGYEQIRGFVETNVPKKLKNVPPENIQTPPAHIAVPIIDSLRHTGSLKELRELFASLLATSMNSETAKYAHPAFVEVVRQLSVDEALIIKHLKSEKDYPFLCEAVYEENNIHSSYESLHPEFLKICGKAGVESISQAKTYLDNLQRLKLLEVRHSGYEELVEKGAGYAIRPYDRSPAYELEASRYEALYVTDFGQQFIEACVMARENG